MRKCVRSFSQLILTAAVSAGCMAAQHWTGSEHVFGTVLGRTITFRSASRPAAEARLSSLRGGQPVAASDEAEVSRAQAQLECGTITAQIRDAVLARLKQSQGISVTDADVTEEAKAELAHMDFQAAAAKQQALNTTMSEALSRVYDRGEDPDAVFASLVSAKGYSKATWQSYLAQGKAAPFRQYLSQASAPFPKPSDTTLRSGARSTLERRKLDEAIDRDLAAHDPDFKAYLSEMQASQAAHPDHQSFTIKADHYRYIKAKRDNWWKAQYSQVDILVTDKEEAGRCDVSVLGLRVHYGN
jgi:hypothetical protein